MKKNSMMKKGTAALLAVTVMTGGAAALTQPWEAHAVSFGGLVGLQSVMAKLITIVQTQDTGDAASVAMRLPAVEGLSDQAFADQVNAEIKEKMTSVVEQAKKEAADAKKSWLENGGSEADFRPIEITVDYRLKSLNDRVLSFVVYETQTGASYYENQYFYNIDLKDSKELSLENLLGKDYVTIANRQIAAEIAQRSKNPENTYFDGSEGFPGFSTIAPDQSFYVNEAGNPVIVFNKYEIAPGSMGIQEFEVIK